MSCQVQGRLLSLSITIRCKLKLGVMTLSMLSSTSISNMIQPMARKNGKPHLMSFNGTRLAKEKQVYKQYT